MAVLDGELSIDREQTLFYRIENGLNFGFGGENDAAATNREAGGYCADAEQNEEDNRDDPQAIGELQLPGLGFIFLFEGIVLELQLVIAFFLQLQAEFCFEF